jgi:uncharacterized membrane protein
MTSSAPVDPHAALAAELDALGHRLRAMGVELGSLTAVATPRGAVHDTPVVTDDTPHAAEPPDLAKPEPEAELEPSETPGDLPWAGPSELSGARLLAWTGGAVTLVGVVLLLVLAASRGWLAPPQRIGLGAVLGATLVGLGDRLHRRPTARPGALAVAATGFATLYLVVAASATVYDYLTAPAALALALVVAVVGLAAAVRWGSELLACGVVVGAVALAPAVSRDWLLVALALVLQVAALPVLLRRRWSALVVVAAVGPVLYGAGVGALLWGSAEEAPTVAVVLGVLVACLATALGASWALDGPIAARGSAALVAAGVLPAAVTAWSIHGTGGAALVGSAALVLGAFAVVHPATPIRMTAVAAAAFGLLETTLLLFDGSTIAAVLLGEAAVIAVAAALTRARFAVVVAAALGALGVVAGLRHAPAPVAFPYRPLLDGALVTTAGIAALVLVLSIALLVACGRVGRLRSDADSARLWAPIGAVGLYGASTLVVALALLVAPDRTGFTAGHALVTVSWAFVALVLLARGISDQALRVTGLVLVGAALAKLVLFDLVALDGMARVGAFLGAGLVLLAAGARYARLVAESAAAPDEEPARVG